MLLRQEGPAWLGRWLREMVLHAAVWMLLLAPYLAFNQWVSGTWMPNTYTIKAVARNSAGDVRWTSGLPAAWLHRDLPAVLRCFYLWMPMMLGTLVIGLLVNNAVLAWKLPRAIWRSRTGWLGPAGLLAGLSLLGFPLARALVDPLAIFQFQFQRYFGHVTALMVLLAVAGWASVAAEPGRRLRIGAVVASLFGLLTIGWQPVVAVKNINEMQVRIGRWIDANTPPDAVVATNDVGAIAFYGCRRIIDTVGLTEPPLARHYLAGGTLEEYLRLKRPDYACLFANWHDGIAWRSDLFQPMPGIPRVRLPDNVICGGGTMYVLRTCWNEDFDPNWNAGAKARAERIARRTARKAAAADPAANEVARQ